MKQILKLDRKFVKWLINPLKNALNTSVVKDSEKKETDTRISVWFGFILPVLKIIFPRSKRERKKSIIRRFIGESTQ